MSWESLARRLAWSHWLPASSETPEAVALVRAEHQEIELHIDTLARAPTWPLSLPRPHGRVLKRMAYAAFVDSETLDRLYTLEEVLAEYG